MSRKELANAIRALSMDAVQKPIPATRRPMGMADIAEVLWNDFLKHNPTDPTRYDRDRFILSNGHASMLLYSLLHLSGYDLPLEELKTSASCTPKRRATRRSAIRRVLKPLPARWARAGECRRHGDCRAYAGRAVQPARPRDCRSLHLCLYG